MAITGISGSTSPITTGGELTESADVGATSVDSVATNVESSFAAATGPSGTVSTGGVDYVCKNGKVFVGDNEVGTVNDAGDYQVTLKGPDGTPQQYSGSVSKLIGASVHGELSDGTHVDIDSVSAPDQRYTMSGEKITCAGPGQPQFVQGRELKADEDIDPFGNLIRWHRDQKTGERDGYQIIEHAPANLGPDDSTVVAQCYNSKYPEKSYREFSNGTRVPWDGKVPELAKASVPDAGPTPAPKEVVEALKKQYLAATGVPLNQGQLELVGYTQSVRDPEYLQVLQKQGEAVKAAYEQSLGRPPTTAEKLYWVNLSTDLTLMKRGLDSLNNPVKTSKQALENLAKSLATSNSGSVAVEPAGDLPATPTQQGLMGAQTEQALIKERTPLVNPPFVKTPADAAAFERLRAASKLRGVDITNNATSAGWAEQMLLTGTARDPDFYAMVDQTIAAVRAAYQKQLGRAPSQEEIADWVPFSANQAYNRRRAAEVLVDLQKKDKLDEVTARIQRR